MKRNNQGNNSKIKPLNAIPSTIKEQITEQLFTQVLKSKQAVGFGKKRLVDYATDKRFTKEFLQMYIESIQRIFGVSIFKVKDQTVSEIIDFLCKNKQNSVYFNNYEKLSGAQPYTKWKQRR